MRVSQLFTKTSKSSPAGEVSRNAQLLIRAGFVHKEMAGVYAFLPLGLRVLDNIKQIVREEMDAVGGQEVQMTVLQPKDIFEKTDRWDDAKVDNWFKTKLAGGAELGLGLTHEEPVVDILTPFVNSYKDLPVLAYQIQTKFRNELRAKSGLLRGREFIMKDMYSFARTQAEHAEIYERVAEAYRRVYKRLGLGEDTFRVKADGGIFTEKFSDEFQTLSAVGEDTLFRVPGTAEIYNEEIAPAQAPAVQVQQDQAQLAPMQQIEGKGIIGVEALAEFLHIPVEQTTKTMLYVTETGQVVAAAVRGGYQINEIKLRKIVGAKQLRLADEGTVRRVTAAEAGYAGLINLPPEVRVVVDESCANRDNFEMGANRTNFHAINVNWGRDLPLPETFYDIKTAKPGDLHPGTGQPYEVLRAVEVGNIFPLESKYTDALELFYTDEQGSQQSIIMGCYGLGITRVMGVIAEKFADERGLVWPLAVAPFSVYLARLDASDTAVSQADELYRELTKNGIAVLYDDRDVRAGEKFADADLLGIPFRVVASAKHAAAGQFELKRRTESASQTVSQSELIKIIASRLQKVDIIKDDLNR